jgi:tetratricopeptide (TPR) repeat protein
MHEWKRVIDEMYYSGNKSNDHILELLNYQYGFIAWCLGNNNKDLAEEYISKGEENIRILERNNYELSNVNAYKAAFYGYKIGMNVIQAPFLGPKSIESAEKAITIDTHNPFGYIQYANIQYYMPRAFGGSKKLALENYVRAQLLMESEEELTVSNWNYLSLLTTIAQAYEEIGQTGKAKDYYEKILRIEPGYRWVKNELYPQLKSKMNANNE